MRVYHIVNPTSPWYEIPKKDAKYILLYVDDKIAIFLHGTCITAFASFFGEELEVANLPKLHPYLDLYNTGLLISKYINKSFIPVIFKNISYLYDIEGNFYGTFTSKDNLENKIQELIVNKKQQQ